MAIAVTIPTMLAFRALRARLPSPRMVAREKERGRRKERGEREGCTILDIVWSAGQKHLLKY